MTVFVTLAPSYFFAASELQLVPVGRSKKASDAMLFRLASASAMSADSLFASL
ncbi:hypothetical protein [Streptomyces platensis]|uniref:hypothetical protein n=1 Tax=Streptomyces platensis TaxID=58346 RepID=UPI001F246221|nr:hypothetical protein [Streptomyces platensis]